MAKTTSKPLAIDPTVPRFQPGGYDPESGKLAFESMSIWWWNCGIWGEGGYAIPNDSGKPTSGNETIRKMVNLIGAELFNLMHRPDVKFSRPFNAQWLFDLNKMLSIGIKRMADASIGWSDERDGDSSHATNTAQAFRIFPVPFFGGRVRQQDALTWCGQILDLLTDMMGHTDNDYDDNVTDLFTSMVQMGLSRVQKDMAMKYLGMTREQVEADAFVIPPDSFDHGVYNPEPLFTSQEMTEERMPEQWWPTSNDLTPIKGLPATVVKVFAEPWPEAGDLGDGGAVEAAWPGGGVGLIPRPGSRR